MGRYCKNLNYDVVRCWSTCCYKNWQWTIDFHHWSR